MHTTFLAYVETEIALYLLKLKEKLLTLKQEKSKVSHLADNV